MTKTSLITSDYNDRSIATSITLPLSYLQYIKKILPYTGASNFSQLVLIALSQQFPSPESFEKEEAEILRLMQGDISRRNLRKTVLATDTNGLLVKAMQMQESSVNESILDEHEIIELEDHYFHIYMKDKKYILQVCAEEDRKGEILVHKWNKNDFVHSKQFCEEQAKAIWSINNVESLNLFNKEEFVNIVCDLLLGLSK